MSMKVLAWYVDPNGKENKVTLKILIPMGIKKKEL